MEIVTILIIGSLLTWAWLVILGIIAVKYDDTLDSFQKKAQIVLIFIVPFFGSALVLHLVNQHSPEAIPKSLIPWPLTSLIFGKQVPRNRNRNNNEEAGIDLAVSSRQDSHFGSGSGGGDGGDLSSKF